MQGLHKISLSELAQPKVVAYLQERQKLVEITTQEMEAVAAEVRDLEALQKCTIDEHHEATFIAKAQVQTIANTRKTITETQAILDRTLAEYVQVETWLQAIEVRRGRLGEQLQLKGTTLKQLEDKTCKALVVPKRYSRAKALKETEEARAAILKEIETRLRFIDRYSP